MAKVISVDGTESIETVADSAPAVIDEAPVIFQVSPAACALRAVADALRRLGPCNDVSLAKSFQREADNLDLIAKGL